MDHLIQTLIPPTSSIDFLIFLSSRHFFPMACSSMHQNSRFTFFGFDDLETIMLDDASARNFREIGVTVKRPAGVTFCSSGLRIFGIQLCSIIAGLLIRSILLALSCCFLIEHPLSRSALQRIARFKVRIV